MRPYVCGICGHTFIKADILQKHVEEHCKSMFVSPGVTIATGEKGGVAYATQVPLSQYESSASDQQMDVLVMAEGIVQNLADVSRSDNTNTVSMLTAPRSSTAESDMGYYEQTVESSEVVHTSIVSEDSMLSTSALSQILSVAGADGGQETYVIVPGVDGGHTVQGEGQDTYVIVPGHEGAPDIGTVHEDTVMVVSDPTNLGDSNNVVKVKDNNEEYYVIMTDESGAAKPVVIGQDAVEILSNEQGQEKADLLTVPMSDIRTEGEYGMDMDNVGVHLHQVDSSDQGEEELLDNLVIDIRGIQGEQAAPRHEGTTSNCEQIREIASVENEVKIDNVFKTNNL